MRRALAILVVLAACGTVFSLGALLAGPESRHAIAEARDPLAWMMLAHPAALAQEVMQFKSVPAESVSRPGRPRTSRSSVPPPVVVPGAPVPPEAAAPPAPPDLRADESGDVVRFGSDITVREGQVISGDVVAMGGDVTVNGHVEKDVVAMGGDVFLGPNGIVDGQVVTFGGKLHEQPGSHVGGPRVTAEGLPRHWFGGPLFGFLGVVNSGIKAMWAIARMLLMLLIAWGITQLAPQRTHTAAEALKREPLKSLGFGLLAAALFIPSVVAMVLVVAILCITIIGIPLALAVVLGYILAVILLCVWGYVVGASVLGERLALRLGRATPSLTLMAVWGIVALTAVRIIGHLFGALPMGGFAGGVLVFLATVAGGVLATLGAGAILWTQLRRDALRQWWPGARAAEAPIVPPVPPIAVSGPPGLGTPTMPGVGPSDPTPLPGS